MIDEKQIIEELRRGSMLAFNQLYEMYSGMLFSFSKSLLKSDDEAEDIVQDTFLKVWIKRKDISPEYAFKSYIFTLAKNQILSGFRNKVIHLNIDNHINELELVLDENAETIFFNQEIHRLISYSESQLSEFQLKIFNMSKKEGLSTKEIALKLEVSQQTIKNNLSQIMKILRQQLKELRMFGL